jgi:hypothetical protein
MKFGVEIEVTGAAHDSLVNAVVTATGGTVTCRDHGYLNATVVVDQHYRSWEIKNDSSLCTVNGHDGREIVTPPLEGDADIDLMQRVVRAVKAAGAIAHRSCSVHVHIDAAGMTPAAIANLTKIVSRYESLIYQALGTLAYRKTGYCKPVEPDVVARMRAVALNRADDNTINRAWFGELNLAPQHYHNARYHGLNLNNIWRSIRTVEFRYANASLHAGNIKALVQFYSALMTHAQQVAHAQATPITTDNPRYTFRNFLNRIGLIGSKFDTCRHHMLKRLDGNSAWRSTGRRLYPVTVEEYI